KPAAGASHAALDFVGDQQRVVLAGKLVRGVGKGLAHRTDAAFTLHKLKTNGADGGIKFAFQISDVIKANKLHTRHNRRKWRTVFFLVRGGQSAEGPAVESMLQGKNAPLWFFGLG